jgi:hypothetical protein
MSDTKLEVRPKPHCCEKCCYVRCVFAAEDLGACPDCGGTVWVRLIVRRTK